jgi:hypothetical protein
MFPQDILRVPVDMVNVSLDIVGHGKSPPWYGEVSQDIIYASQYMGQVFLKYIVSCPGYTFTKDMFQISQDMLTVSL